LVFATQDGRAALDVVPDQGLSRQGNPAVAEEEEEKVDARKKRATWCNRVLVTMKEAGNPGLGNSLFRDQTSGVLYLLLHRQQLSSCESSGGYYELLLLLWAESLAIARGGCI
jgi:hypothetical protein